MLISPKVILIIKIFSKILGFLIVIASIVGYGEYRNYQLSSQMKVTEANLQAKISETQGIVTQILTENSSLNSAVQSVQSNGALYSAQAGQISDVASTLYRLSKTDPKLLEKYSKVYFLNENYKPVSLTNIDPKFLYNKDSNLQVNTQISSYLTNFLNASQTAGINLKIISAYRSFGTQAQLKSSYKITYGAGTANSFSADQGYSEHQLGTAIDFTTPTVGDTFIGFEKTPEYTWLINNAYLYGFVLSYPPNNKYYTYEPWHWRFVGVDLATKLHRDGQNFYELDQNVINDYLSVMFD